MSYLRQRIRVECDPGLDQAPTNVVTGSEINAIRAVDWQFELGLFYGRALQSVADFASVTLEVRGTRTGAPLLSKTILAASLDNTVDATTWSNRTKQHVTVQFTAEETAGISMDGGDTKRLWLVVKGLTTVTTTPHWTYGLFTVTEAGIQATGAPAAGNPVYYTAAQIDALLAAILNGTTPFNALRIYNPTLDGFQLAQPKEAPPGTVWTFTDKI